MTTEPGQCPKCCEGWICEAHSDKPWPHGDCLGPGMPCDLPGCPLSLCNSGEDGKPRQTLVERLATANRPTFKPGIRYNRHGNQFEVYWADEFSFTEDVAPGLSVYRSVKSGAVTGCKILDHSITTVMDAVVVENAERAKQCIEPAGRNGETPGTSTSSTTTPTYHVRKRYSNGCEVCPEIWQGDKWVATVAGSVREGFGSVERAQAMCELMNGGERQAERIKALAVRLVEMETVVRSLAKAMDLGAKAWDDEAIRLGSVAYELVRQLDAKEPVT